MKQTLGKLEKLANAYDYQQNYEDKVNTAAVMIRQGLGFLMRDSWQPPEFGIVLGSGLGGLADEIEGAKTIPYNNIPHFPRTTVPGHEGKLIYGNIKGVPVIALKGRKHFYEVADEPFNTGMLQVLFPVHVLANLGVKNYFATNAAGGLNPKYNVGDIMVISSHINMMPNALLGKQHKFKRADGEDTWRFQPMNDAYDEDMTYLLYNEALRNSSLATCHRGVYLAVTGPSYETSGECLAFRDSLKADAVGMSTAPEVLAARNRGMRCVAMSCITNKIAEDGTNATNHEEVKAILDSEAVRTRLCSAVKNFFSMYSIHWTRQALP